MKKCKIQNNPGEIGPKVRFKNIRLHSEEGGLERVVKILKLELELEATVKPQMQRDMGKMEAKVHFNKIRMHGEEGGGGLERAPKRPKMELEETTISMIKSKMQKSLGKIKAKAHFSNMRSGAKRHQTPLIKRKMHTTE